jgi:hypothetical protein
MSEQESKHYHFPKWANKVPILILLSLGGVLLVTTFVIWYWFTPKNFDVGYMPEQPIPYSHRLHAGELGIDCRYCHTQVDKGAHATIPPTQTCMNCHDQIKTDSPHIKKIKESFESDTPIEWVKVHVLPDYAYFDHSRHVNSGVSCVSCHGRVDKMDVVRQVESLSMSWCLECHRSPEKSIRPKDKVTDLSWKPGQGEDALSIGRELVKKYHIKPREDCSTCHR